MVWSIFAQSPSPVSIGWEDLARQVPLLAVALAVAWFAFRHITKQHESQLKDLRDTHERTLDMMKEAATRLEAAKDAQIRDVTLAKDAQIRDLTASLQKERDENTRLLRVIESIGGTAK